MSDVGDIVAGLMMLRSKYGDGVEVRGRHQMLRVEVDGEPSEEDRVVMAGLGWDWVSSWESWVYNTE